MSGDPREDAGPATEVPGADRRWRFGAVVFDESSLELTVQGSPVPLERKCLEVLRQLLYHAGEVVTKDELMESVWPGRFLSETVIAKAISRIRQVIGDEDESVIKTQRGYGYRLVADVTVEAVRAAAPPRLSLKAGDHPPLRPQWSLVEQLGSGGQGEIWLVRHDKLPEQRVYKFALDSGGLVAIKREITLYRLLRNALGERDDFVEVLDWNLEEAPYFIELEHAAAGNLETWIQAQGGFEKIPLDQRLAIVARIADALAAAHSVGVLHKDLKPSNVLINCHPERPFPGHPERSEGSSQILRSAQNDDVGIKLSDFGSGSVLDLAKLEAAGITQLGFTRTTPTDEAAATHLYMAPEILTGQPATVLGDVYSLGVVLYQMVVGDLRKPLSPGWELNVPDPLLREDIAAAVAGDPSRRLRDPGVLATRIRTLDARRQARAEQEQALARALREQEEAQARARTAELQVARLRARRQWMLTALSILLVGVAVTIGLFLEARRARNEAAAAAHTSQTVADFLSKDLFAVVGNKPLRDLTVKELLDSAAMNLEKREKEMPEAATQIHAAIGNAFYTMLEIDLAEKHLETALKDYERREGPSSASAIMAATQLLLAKSLLGTLAPDLPKYEAMVAQARVTRGRLDPLVLAFANAFGEATFSLGHWRAARDASRTLVADAKSAPDSDPAVRATAERVLAIAHLRLGELDDAERVIRESIVHMDGHGGGWSLNAGTAHVALGMVLTERERFAEAQREFTAARELTLPWSTSEASGYLTTIRYYSGVAQLRAGHAQEAIQTLEGVLREIVGLSWNDQGADLSPEIVMWLARAYEAGGRLQDAELTIRKAVAGAEKRFGASHSVTQDARIELADVLRQLGRLREARASLASVEPRTMRELGPDHPFAAEKQRVEGLVAAAERRPADARRALAEALRIYRLLYGDKHTVVRRAQVELAAIRSQGDD